MSRGNYACALFLGVFGLIATACTGPAGSSCTVTDNGDGTSTIACDDGTTVTVSNGDNGSSCTVTDNGDGTKTITCTDGTSVTITDGEDGISCSIHDNGNGTRTITCTDGTSVTVTDGNTGANVEIADLHGTDFLMTTGEFATGKFFATATITSATADAAGVVTVNYTVATPEGDPVTNLIQVSANISKLVPAGAGESSNKWVPYLYRTQTVSGSANGDWPNPDGTVAYQAYRESSATSGGTFVNNDDGSYTYVFGTNISNITVDGTPVTYERNLTHRLSIMMGGHSGATADAVYDFVPDGSALTEVRDIVPTSVCKSCHGEELHGHGGDRLTVENCVTCHVPGSVDPHGGESVDMKVMIHKMHAGGELASIPGADGIVWDNPATAGDESADNGSYAIWGNGNRKATWWKVGFPAIIENCTKCHQGAGAGVDNWKTRPSRAACGSCHDNVDFASGTNHGGGAQTDDSACATCHPSSGANPDSVPNAHDWTVKDPRNIPEFTANVTVSPPANGSYFVAGESPVVSVILSEAGTPLNHTTVIEDATAEGCQSTGCPARDGAFRTASLFVHGPRALRTPVLTTSARAQILSTSTGPFDLSAASASLVLVLDRGEDLVRYNRTGGDYTLFATVTVPVAGGTFANLAAATTDEIVTWLNAHTAFSGRAIAYNQGGRVGIRSRNLGKMHALELRASAVATSVFGGDLNVKMPTGSTTSNNISQRTVPANNDPKAAWTAGAISYTLDPVDDLAPGTYIVTIEMTDRGRIDAVNYQTPTVAKVYFQVGTATPEPQVAGNCGSCHWGPDGKGFILDFSRHFKIFDDTAVDQCGACHDYQPQSATGTGWTGSRPISKRVHAIHFGSSLTTPLQTVDYSNGDPIAGRNWDITLPQDVRNCQTCHPDSDSSGTWATQAARLPCWGCHDSAAVKAHMKLQTYDPTPTDPFSGDEQESCATCH